MYGKTYEPSRWRAFRLPTAALFVLLGLAMLAGPMRAGESQKFPDVLAVDVREEAGNGFAFHVTVSSPYDTPQRYADAFRVSGSNGEEYGVRVLWHDHAGEQPFTRSLHGVRIPEGVRKVIVQARDKKYGYGGRVVEANLPGR